MNSVRNYRFLNRDNEWPGFRWDGLERGGDDELRLIPLPRAVSEAPASLGAAPVAEPLGIALDHDGSVLYVDRAANRIVRVNSCDESAPWMEGLSPAAMLIPAHRRALYVTAGQTVRVLDLDTGHLREEWSGFDSPVSLADGANGEVYVCDAGDGRVHRYGITGSRETAFWDREAADAIEHPIRVASDGAMVAILTEAGKVYVLDGDGVIGGWFDAGPSSSLAIAGEAILVGSERKRIACFRRAQDGSWRLAGDAAGFNGPTAGIAASRRTFWVLPGAGFAPLRFDTEGAWSNAGSVWSEPLAIDRREHAWHRIQALANTPPGTHAQLYWFLGDSAPGPFPDGWITAGSDVMDAFLGGPPSRRFGVGLRLTGDGAATPSLSQMRIHFDHDSYLPHLPAVYRDESAGNFTRRFLSLFETVFGELESGIAEIETRLSAAGAPAATLPWLAGFLALEFEEETSEADRREAIASAFERYARRGTKAGIAEAVLRETGVRVTILEPLAHAGWWSMPAGGEGAALGIGTVLAGAEPAGAIVGATATMDRSHLTGGDQFGEPLFADLAHRFTAVVHHGELRRPDSLDRVRAVLTRESPAHTAFEICVLEPGIRAGLQSRLGIDTVIGPAASGGKLGSGAIQLGGRERGRVGARLGVTSRL